MFRLPLWIIIKCLFTRGFEGRGFLLLTSFEWHKQDELMDMKGKGDIQDQSLGAWI